ncbi:hypothetical protein EDEG_01741 [Edhazardia aedis USNM 41457]|uniref:Uncharacterized protein n=1 Tax=Edhazardia aedis (strain USNM 41457) TaxID=1003232 RepID=J9D8Z6_EDHAE|nr:hypothetical protein EDEG_01741 [Edhazardia aedis USNM 41457]|eukprot:EJW03974.1 hypothetical protein EDEG_01741 [Edhazardia aedis USNM 41457]
MQKQYLRKRMKINSFRHFIALVVCFSRIISGFVLDPIDLDKIYQMDANLGVQKTVEEDNTNFTGTSTVFKTVTEMHPNPATSVLPVASLNRTTSTSQSASSSISQSSTLSSSSIQSSVLSSSVSSTESRQTQSEATETSVLADQTSKAAEIRAKTHTDIAHEMIHHDINHENDSKNDAVVVYEIVIKKGGDESKEELIRTSIINQSKSKSSDSYTITTTIDKKDDIDSVLKKITDENGGNENKKDDVKDSVNIKDIEKVPFLNFFFWR